MRKAFDDAAPVLGINVRVLRLAQLSTLLLHELLRGTTLARTLVALLAQLLWKEGGQGRELREGVSVPSSRIKSLWSRAASKPGRSGGI